MLCSGCILLVLYKCLSTRYAVDSTRPTIHLDVPRAVILSTVTTAHAQTGRVCFNILSFSTFGVTLINMYISDFNLTFTKVRFLFLFTK